MIISTTRKENKKIIFEKYKNYYIVSIVRYIGGKIFIDSYKRESKKLALLCLNN